ncbi:RDD family protein [Sulfurimonas sp. C5]|uniref:RDD family protein n=1 Tax=Sulfurimonas sp. C5 TaxID=3036947 RepID=UPI0024575A9B|nr:RDD family protein [Sulfurimonas sp. C5]MDH4944446.1 RDD family protein [Sulfurimonas sp. C5]
MRFRDLKKQKKNQQDTQKKKVLKYASYPDRIKAFVVDMFMIYTPILYFIAYVVMGSKEEFQASQLAPLIAVSIYGVIYAVLIAKFGQTPGKKAYMIKIVDDKTMKNISFFRAICRFIMFLFSTTILLGLLTPFYRRDKKALHDIVCGTIEIETKEMNAL